MYLKLSSEPLFFMLVLLVILIYLLIEGYKRGVKGSQDDKNKTLWTVVFGFSVVGLLPALGVLLFVVFMMGVFN